jgi:hypothetical protein
MYDVTNFEWLTEQSAHSDKAWGTLYKLAEQQIWRCIKEPAKYRDDPLTRLCAEYAFTHQSAHQCYWNNRFVIAVMCGLDLEKIRLAAWCLVSNGLNEYFEWITHAGYPMSQVFDHLGITHEQPRYIQTMHYKLDHRVCKQLIEEFQLPTTKLCPSRILTDEEQHERIRMNREYPHSDSL